MSDDMRTERLTSRSAWLRLGAAWLIVVAAVAVWLLTMPIASLREQLKVAQFWSLETCLFLALACGALVIRDLRQVVDRADVLRMSALALLAIVLTAGVAPRTNRIFYDEQLYQSIGQNLADLKRAQICNDGSVEYGTLVCTSGEYNKQPYAYPHVLSVAYRLAGTGPRSAFVVNTLAMAATVVSMYLLIVLLFEDRAAAFFAALLIALTPQQIMWSATAASEPSASAACVVALTAAAYFLRSRRTSALAATAVATAYAVQFRPESILIVPIVVALLWLRARDEFMQPRLWWAGLLFLILVAVHGGHLVAVRNEGWGTTADRLSFAYLAPNLRVNGGFYLGDGRFPVIFTALAMVGLLTGREPNRKPARGEPFDSLALSLSKGELAQDVLVEPRAEARPSTASGRALRGAALRPGSERLWVFAYFLVFFGIDLFFYAGSYNYGADVRYSLMTYPPLAVLGGLGASRIARWIERIEPRLPARSVVAAGLAFQFLWYAPLVRATTEEAWAARADVRFAQSLVPRLRGNTYVLTHNPGMFHVWGINAGQMSLAAANPEYLDSLGMRYSGGVYLHWNFWCNVADRVQREFCRSVRNLRPMEIVDEYRERDQRFALYRIEFPNPTVYSGREHDVWKQ